MNTFRRSWPHLMIVILTLSALFLRWDLNANTEVIAPVRADAVDYYFGAYNLLQFGTYSKQVQPPDQAEHVPPQPDALRPPGYSLFIAPFIEFPPTEQMIAPIRLLQVVLSALVVTLVCYALLPFVGPWATGAAGFLVAISPHLMSMNIYLLTESLYTFSLALLMLLLSRFCRTAHFGYAAGIGVVVAVSALVRPTSLYLTLVIIPFAYFVWSSRSGQSRWLPVLAMALGFSLVYAPWAMRNNTTDLAETRSLSIDTLHKGMYPGLMYRGDPTTFGIPNRADPAFVVRGKHLDLVVREIVRRVKEEPAEYLRWYAVGKPLMFLSFDIIVGMGDVFVYPVSKTNMFSDPVLSATHALSRVLHWPITVLALVMMMVIWLPSMKEKLSREALLFFRILSAVLAYFIAVHAVGTPLPRYSIPIRPLIFSMGAGLVYLLVRSALARKP